MKFFWDGVLIVNRIVIGILFWKNFIFWVLLKLLNMVVLNVIMISLVLLIFIWDVNLLRENLS